LLNQKNLRGNDAGSKLVVPEQGDCGAVVPGIPRFKLFQWRRLRFPTLPGLPDLRSVFADVSVGSWKARSSPHEFVG
jgi:hypothetical protein